MFQKPINRKFNPKAWLNVIKIDEEFVKTVLFKYSIFFIVFIIIFYTAFYSLQQEKVVSRPENAEESQFAIIPVSEINENENGIKLIEDRAKSTIDLYRQGKIQRIFISGQIDSTSINTINIVRNLLLQENIPEFILVEDEVSTSIYQTCYRAKTQYGINQGIIVTQEYNMPRALYTCSSLGIEVQGLESDRSIYTDIRNLNLSERFKILRAFLDVIILRPEYNE